MVLPAAPTLDVPPEGRTLEGRRGLTLQWISWEPDEWGSVDFVPIGFDRYAVLGRQDGPDGDYVSIDGVMTRISEVELRFDGVVEVRVGFTNDGRVCVREGPLTFLSTQGRRFWRMQDLLNCDGIVTDYVDIYFD